MSTTSSYGSNFAATIETGHSHTGEVTYTVAVTPLNYKDDCSFNLYFLVYNDTIDGYIGGANNVTPITRYTYFNASTSASNPVLTNRVFSNGNEQYFLFTATAKDTVSVHTRVEGLRFKIKRVADGTVIYDSANDNSAHFMQQGSSTNYVERARGTKIGLVNGQKYYCIVYRDPSYTGVVYSHSTSIYIGSPALNFGYVTVNSPSSISVGSSSYSNWTTTVSGLPVGAEAYQITLNYSGTTLSKLSSLQYRSGTSAFTAAFNFAFNIPYTYESGSNKPANGSWTVGYKAASTAVNLTPGFKLSYYYEVGQ